MAIRSSIPLRFKSGAISLPRLETPTALHGTEADPLKIWCLRVLTFTSVGYILTSQGLASASGWSRLAIVVALFQLLVIAGGLALRTLHFTSLGWVWFSLAFVAFATLRSVPHTGQEWSSEAIFQLVSSFAGGIGVALALQAGVAFRALALAQTAIFLGNVVAGALGIGAGTPGEGEASRAAGLTGNANELALQLTLGACLIWLFPKRAGALACSLAVAAVGYAVMTTGSRKSLFALALFAALVCIQLFVALKAWRLRLLLLLIGPALAAGAIVAPILLERATGVVAVQRALDLEDHSVATRMGMAQQAMRLWKEAPVLGWGTDSFSRISGYGMYAHNNYAELLCDLGVAGTLLFYTLHVYILLKSLRLPMPTKLYCVIFVLMIAALDFGAVSYTRKQTIMVLMILAVVASNPAFLFRSTSFRHTSKSKRRVSLSPRSAPDFSTPAYATPRSSSTSGDGRLEGGTE